MTVEEKPRAWPDELPDSIDIALDRCALPDDGRPEPGLASVPFFVEYDEPARLDPQRVGLLWELPPRRTSPIRARGPLTSLLIHLLPLLTVIGWPHPTLEVPRPIPVQLVIEQPPPPPPEPPQPQQQAPDLRRASEDTGEVKPPQPNPSTSSAPAAAGEPQPEPAAPPPPPTQTAHLVAPPPPVPPPKPPPPKESAFKLPKLAGLPLPHREDVPRPAPRAARYPGPVATRDEYLAYLVTLTRQHIDLLPLSMIGTRRGETILTVQVRDDGALARISIYRSSGYRDIDERIEQMVRAVGRFPPVPQWFQGNVMELQLTVRFPEALER